MFLKPGGRLAGRVVGSDAKPVDGQVAGTFKVPANWDGNDETIDLKYHFTMPAGMKRVVAVLTWEAAQGFNLNFSTGTGFCPDSGDMKLKTIKSGGEAVLQYSPGSALEQMPWFIHLGAENAADMKGKSLAFKARVALLP